MLARDAALNIAVPIDSVVDAEIASAITEHGAQKLFTFSIAEPGRLEARVEARPASAFDTALALLGPDGQLLIESDDATVRDRNPFLAQHLTPGSYTLAVSASSAGRSTGAFTLSTEFQRAIAPFAPVPVGSPRSVGAEASNRDGQDAATSNSDPNDAAIAPGQVDRATPSELRFAVGDSPMSLAVGDFNGDHLLDLASANADSNDLSILLGQGDGTFRPEVRFQVGAGPISPTAGDFNGDSLLDLATSNARSDDVSILLGNGDGTFQPQVRFPVGSNPIGLTAGDFNGDGRLDLASESFTSNAFFVLLGEGDGTFEVRQFQASASFSLSAADFNGDGRLDLAGPNRSDSDLSILLGNGDGTFEQKGRFQVGKSPLSVQAGDFNGDDRLDLVTANLLSNDISLLLGNGDGTFHQKARTKPRFAVGDAPTSLSIGDFDGDGRLDLATANIQSNDVSVLLGKGDGTFQPETRFRVGEHPEFLTAGDFNGDGHLDLATANSASNEVSVLLGNGDGSFPFQVPLENVNQVRHAPVWLTAADFNGDSHLDLATANNVSDDVSVLLSRGDGTFQPQSRFPVGRGPESLTAGDFNSDGRVDLATANESSDDVSILLGQGEGTFQPQVRFRVGNGPFSLITADFNDDGLMDLATANFSSDDLSILLGDGDGRFQPEARFQVGDNPLSLRAEDFNGDGRLDLASVNSNSDDVSVLLGKGDGTFQPQVRFHVGGNPLSVTSGDFNADGRLDLATANSSSDNVSILLGHGDGTFGPQTRVQVTKRPTSVIARDFNADGRLDLATTSVTEFGRLGDVFILLGEGNGTFQPKGLFKVGDAPFSLTPADFNGDGQLDLATANSNSDDLSILLGKGDGTFQPDPRFQVGKGPVGLTAAGDFNGDGRLDLASANESSDDVSLLLSNGDGTFQPQARFSVGVSPRRLTAGDLNGDGRLDLATVNSDSSDVSILLGNGDGTFQPEARFRTGNRPFSLTVGDFNENGRLDLATANRSSDDVSILLGDGDGMFQPHARFAAGDTPNEHTTADFNRDGHLDLATVNLISFDVSVVLGNGDGTFQSQSRLRVGHAPFSVTQGDFNGDGLWDLATANFLSADISVLLGNGDGTFQREARVQIDDAGWMTAADFNADGRGDLAIANFSSNYVSLLLGNIDGTFQPETRFSVGNDPAAPIVGDFNGDGRLDLATPNVGSDDLTILLGNGDGTFVNLGKDVPANPLRSPPQVLDFNNDATLDSVILRRDGRILYRQGRPDSPGAFDPPVTVNPDSPARDMAIVAEPEGPRLAAIDQKGDSVSKYALLNDGTFAPIAGVRLPGSLPNRIESADLNRDGWGDLAVINAGDGDISVFFADQRGGFSAPVIITAGNGPAELSLVDVDGDGAIDILAANQLSGDVSVVLNEGSGAFTERRFRTNQGLYGISEDLKGQMAVKSEERTSGVVAGDFNGDGTLDIVAANPGSNSFALLAGKGDGALVNPQRFLFAGSPAVAQAADFNDDGQSDLAMLDDNQGVVFVLLSGGDGQFTQTARAPAGSTPTGLSVDDIDGDGKLDLLVGNDFGDVLILPGNGDGTFQPFRRIGKKIGLATADLDRDGQTDFIYANESLDRIFVDFSQDQDLVRDRQQDDDLLAPGKVRVEDLNLDGKLDLAVANTGGNSVLVYLGADEQVGQPFQRARSFFTGVEPVDVVVEDLNLDQVPDLVVANEGSNDVTVLLGQGQGVGWTLINGPRLHAGLGPVSTAVWDVTGPVGDPDGKPDLLVTNNQSNDVFLMQGLGGGFFNDLRPTIFPTGNGPVRSIPVEPGPALATINSRSNTITFFAGFDPLRRFDIPTGGQAPVGGLAGDFNFDGVDDLVVAHNGDGLVSFLLGGPTGFEISDIITNPRLPHPTDLALVEQAGELLVFGVGEGAEAAHLLFVFGPAAIPESVLARGSLAEVVVDFSTLQGSTLAIVATLLILGGVHDGAELPNTRNTLMVEVDTELIQIDEDRGGSSSVETNRRAKDEETDKAEADGASGSDLFSFVMGLDEALEEAHEHSFEQLLNFLEHDVAMEELFAVFLDSLSGLLPAFAKETTVHSSTAQEAAVFYRPAEPEHELPPDSHPVDFDEQEPPTDEGDATSDGMDQPSGDQVDAVPMELESSSRAALLAMAIDRGGECQMKSSGIMFPRRGRKSKVARKLCKTTR